MEESGVLSTLGWLVGRDDIPMDGVVRGRR